MRGHGLRGRVVLHEGEWFVPFKCVRTERDVDVAGPFDEELDALEVCRRNSYGDAWRSFDLSKKYAGGPALRRQRAA